MAIFASRPFTRPLLVLTLGLSMTTGGAVNADHAVNADRERAKAQAQPAAATPSPLSYYGIYLSGVKLGWETIARDHTTRNGVPIVRTETDSTMLFTIGSSHSQIVTTDISWVNADTGALVFNDVKTESSGRVTETKADYMATGVDFTSSIAGQEKKTHLDLPSGRHFLVDPTTGAGVTPKVGMRAEGMVLNAPLAKLVNARVDIVGKENVTIGGQSVSAFKVIETNELDSAIFYADDAGDTLRIDVALAGRPMLIVKEAKDVALAPVGTPINLVAATSNHPVGASLADARRAKSITYRLGNISRPLPASDTVETIDYVASPASPASSATTTDRTATVTIRATPLPDAATAPPLFATAPSAPADLQPYLQPTTFIASDSPRFHQIAESIVGRGGTNCVDAAKKIAAYVHRTVKPDPSITSLRTATDVCNDPRGVCRDYTALFAAIARAAGLPTKQCFGLVFDGQNFVGHAWPEVWTGKDASGADRWTAIEPTWGVPFADATHLKLAEGDVTAFFTVANDMTRYKIDVLKVE